MPQTPEEKARIAAAIAQDKENPCHVDTRRKLTIEEQVAQRAEEKRQIQERARQKHKRRKWRDAKRKEAAARKAEKKAEWDAGAEERRKEGNRRTSNRYNAKKRALKEEARKEAEREALRAERRALLQQAKMEKAKEEAGLRHDELVKRELASRELARKHLIPMVLKLHPSYLAGWVHKDIATRLERFSEEVELGMSPRLMLQMPPRAGKSQLASIDFPAHHLGRCPHHEIILATYSGSLAMGFSRKTRALLRDTMYQTLFPGTKLDPDNQNAEGWLTTKGGGYLPAGVGGAVTGKGAHILIIDDPVKNSEEAESETTRSSVKEWYASTAYTRLAPGGGVLVIQTRWHEDDLSGWLETQMKEGEGDEFEIVRYPAIAIEDEKYRRAGEALHPARYDKEALLRIERAVGPRVWDALYQQRPVSETGGYFDRDSLKYYEAGDLPDNLVYYTAWDLAIGKKERNDWTVGVTVGVDKNDDLWVVGMVRKRMDSFQIAESILDTFEIYDDQMVGIEKGQIQLALGPYLEQRIAERRLYQFTYEPLSPGKRDKEVRARAIQGRMKQGRVHFPKDATWLKQMIDELMAFPFGKHDDIVDALAWLGLMLTEMSGPQAERPKKKKTWRDKLDQYLRKQGQTTKHPMAA